MPIRALILNNFWLKLFSLVTATMVWLAIFAVQTDLRPGRAGIGADRTTREFPRVPVTVMQSAADDRAFRVVPTEVAITVAGRASVLRVLTEREIEVFINLTDVRESATVSRPIQVHPPAGVSLVKISDQQARIEPIAPPVAAKP